MFGQSQCLINILWLKFYWETFVKLITYWDLIDWKLKRYWAEVDIESILIRYWENIEGTLIFINDLSGPHKWYSQSGQKLGIFPILGILEALLGNFLMGNSPFRSWGILFSARFVVNNTLNDKFCLKKSSEKLIFYTHVRRT